MNLDEVNPGADPGLHGLASVRQGWHHRPPPGDITYTYISTTVTRAARAALFVRQLTYGFRNPLLALLRAAPLVFVCSTYICLALNLNTKTRSAEQRDLLHIGIRANPNLTLPEV